MFLLKAISLRYPKNKLKIHKKGEMKIQVNTRIAFFFLNRYLYEFYRISYCTLYSRFFSSLFGAVNCLKKTMNILTFMHPVWWIYWWTLIWMEFARLMIVRPNVVASQIVNWTVLTWSIENLLMFFGNIRHQISF